MPSSSGEAEIETSTNVTNVMIRKSVMSQRRGVVESDESIEAGVCLLNGRTRAVEVGRGSTDEHLQGLRTRWAAGYGEYYDDNGTSDEGKGENDGPGAAEEPFG